MTLVKSFLREKSIFKLVVVAACQEE